MITFEEGYRVRTIDDLNYVVESARTNQKGQEVWNVRAYATTGPGAARLLLRCMIADEQGKLRDEMTAWFGEDHAVMAQVRALPKVGESHD